jgi:hypothetical protein
MFLLQFCEVTETANLPVFDRLGVLYLYTVLLLQCVCTLSQAVNRCVDYRAANMYGLGPLFAKAALYLNAASTSLPQRG